LLLHAEPLLPGGRWRAHGLHDQRDGHEFGGHGLQRAHRHLLGAHDRYEPPDRLRRRWVQRHEGHDHRDGERDPDLRRHAELLLHAEPLLPGGRWRAHGLHDQRDGHEFGGHGLQRAHRHLLGAHDRYEPPDRLRRRWVQRHEGHDHRDGERDPDLRRHAELLLHAEPLLPGGRWRAHGLHDQRDGHEFGGHGLQRAHRHLLGAHDRYEPPDRLRRRWVQRHEGHDHRDGERDPDLRRHAELLLHAEPLLPGGRWRAHGLHDQRDGHEFGGHGLQRAHRHLLGAHDRYEPPDRL